MEMIKTFRYSRSVQNIIDFFSILTLVVFSLAFRRDGFSFIGLFAFLFMLALWVLVNLDIRSTVTVDEEKITIQKWIGSLIFRWSEIDDFQCSPRLISIASTGQRKKFKTLRGEYGMSLEPFDVLQREVTQRAGYRLVKEWEQLKLPRTYVNPGLLIGTIVAYLIPLGIILTFFVLLSLETGGHWFGNYLFLATSILVLLPLFIRDYRKSHKKLTLNEEGLRQVNGKEIYLPWQAVTKIIVKEPLAVGYGSIIVESENDGRIWIPRSLMKCGQVLYLIKRKTMISETYGNEN